MEPASKLRVALMVLAIIAAAPSLTKKMLIASRRQRPRIVTWYSTVLVVLFASLFADAYGLLNPLVNILLLAILYSILLSTYKRWTSVQ